MLDRLADLTPNDAAVFREMGMLYLHGVQQPGLANRYFGQSLRLNPDQPDLIQMLVGNRNAPPAAAIPQLPGVPKILGIPTPETPAGMPDT